MHLAHARVAPPWPKANVHLGVSPRKVLGVVLRKVLGVARRKAIYTTEQRGKQRQNNWR